MILSIKLAFYIGPGEDRLFRFLVPFIRFWDQSLITHVEIVVEDDELNYHWISSRPGGVTDRVNYQYDPAEWIFVSIQPLVREQYDQIEEFIRSDVIGAGYDWIGVLFGALIPIRFESKKNWFCSELVRACLRVGHLLIERSTPDYMVTPAKLFNEVKTLPNIKIFYPPQL